MEEYGPCVWQACPFKADDAVLDVSLIYGGRTYTKKRVPLCQDHLQQFGVSRRMRLRAEFLLAVERR